MKKYTVGQIKRKAWTVFSLYVRMKGCLETTGTLTRGKCYTCDKTFPIKALQAGHLLDGHIGMNYLDERGVKCQCLTCNVWNHGLKEVYIPKFIEEHGKELFEELKRLKRTPCTWKVPDYEKFIIDIKEKITYMEEM